MAIEIVFYLRRQKGTKCLNQYSSEYAVNERWEMTGKLFVSNRNFHF